MHFSLKQPEASLATAPQYLKLVEAQDPRFRSLWKEFLGFMTMHGVRYQPHVFEYNIITSSPGAINLSFVIINDKVPIAICPLVIENINGFIQGSLSGGFLPCPILHPGLSEKQRRKIEAMIFEEITLRLNRVGAKRWWVEAEILSTGTDVLEDLLPARFGALDISIQIHLMDLTQSEEAIWAQLRHSSKSIINQGLKTYEFKVYDQNNYTPEVGTRHRLLHHKCSGRVTRPLESFEKMNSWIAEGSALMFEQLFEGKTVQMIIVSLGKHAAIGASAADDPDFIPKVPLTHSINYFIYCELAKRGIWYYEVGETTYRDHIFHMRTQKVRSICDFKRGFGQYGMPHKRWVWFTNYQEELLYIEEQLEAYKKHVSEMNIK